MNHNTRNKFFFRREEQKNTASPLKQQVIDDGEKKKQRKKSEGNNKTENEITYLPKAETTAKEAGPKKSKTGMGMHSSRGLHVKANESQHTTQVFV